LFSHINGERVDRGALASGRMEPGKGVRHPRAPSPSDLATVCCWHPDLP
jgi:hypothetical protein